jgi:serine/threonine-protein kinase
MEFLKGRDLVDHCKDGNLLPVPRVLSIVARVAEALAYAHRQNVVHRDIKPANIMYEDASDTVKVTDFGIARITDASKTKTGLVLGTPSFMSPEQIAGRKVDGRSDLYSLGVTLYQMLTGVLPFRGDSMAELMYKIANEEAPDLRAVRKDLPERLAQVAARALAKKPDLRYQDGEEFARDLRAVLATLTDAAVPVPAAGAPAAADPDRTVAFRAGDGDGGAGAPVMAAGNAFVSPQASPGYDASQIDEQARAPLGKTTVMNKSGDPEGHRAGAGDTTGQEP